jgi:HEPN domain-containing protein
MKPITAEWITKAEGAFAMVECESRARKNPDYDGICFHAQQCAEKYLKACLCEPDIAFSKIHDLVALLETVLSLEPEWELQRENLAFLSEFAVSYCYPSSFSSSSASNDSLGCSFAGRR